MNTNMNFEQSTAMVTAIDVLRSHMDNRFIDAEVLTNKRFEQLESVMNQKFEKADERFDKMDKTFEKIDQQLIAIRNDIRESNAQLQSDIRESNAQLQKDISHLHALHQKDISHLHALHQNEKDPWMQIMPVCNYLLIGVSGAVFILSLAYIFS